MKKIELPMEKLYQFIEKKTGKKFIDDEFMPVPFSINTLDENDHWVEVPKLIKKKALLYETKFSDGTTLRSADDHLISINPEKEAGRLTKDWKEGHEIPYLKIKCVSNKKVEDNADVYSFAINSNTHLYKDARGIIHRNTYGCQRAAMKGILKNKKVPDPKINQFIFKSGSSGSSQTSLLQLLYTFREGFVVMLDDNDGWLANGGNAIVQLMLKGAFDPDTKAIATNPTIRKPQGLMSRDERDLYAAKVEQGGFQQDYDQAFNESIKVKIDKEQLKENVLRVTANGKMSESNINSNEAIELYGRLVERVDPEEEEREFQERQKRYRAVFGDQSHLFERDMDDSGFTSDEQYLMNSAMAMEQDEKGNEITAIPAEFVFNSSVIFISNLQEYDIDTAVLSRVLPYELKLNLSEFEERLNFILPYLAPLKDYSSLDPKEWAWCKQVAFTTLSMLMACRQANAPIFGKRVQFNKKPQFRDIQGIGTQFYVIVSGQALKEGIDIDDVYFDKNIRDRLEKWQMPRLIEWALEYFRKAEKAK